MTMKKGAQEISASEFKAKCLKLLDRVARTRQPLTVTKRGKPVARVVPLVATDPRSLRGSLKIHGDIVAPLDVEWEADR
jgi:prevent-host-death family protein